jgi:protein ImuB
MFAALYLPPRLVPAGTDAATALVAVANEFSPRVERYGDAMVALDISGVRRLFGDAREAGDALRRTAADRGLAVHVAIAATRTAALLLARARAGLTVAAPGTEAAGVAQLPLRALEMGNGEWGVGSGRQNGMQKGESCRIPHSAFPILKRWGLKTLGDLAALPAADLHARLGQEGVRLQRLARGEDAGPLVPLAPGESFEESLELEWPVENLEPLSFVLGRLCEALAVRLERHDRGAAVLHVRFRLVTRETLERRLQLPVPMRDPRVLRTLILLDLESHLAMRHAESPFVIPFRIPHSGFPISPDLPAGIDAVTLSADPAPGPVVQFSLLERATPSPESLSTLLARLTALMGEGRSGAPALVDSHRPEAFEMGNGGWVMRNGMTNSKFKNSIPHSARPIPHCVLRRFRHPIPVRVVVERGRPVRLVSWRRGVAGGRIEQCAGPWRTSGDWWAPTGAGIQESGFGARKNTPAWDRDEWEVAIGDGAVYRIHLDRGRGQWFVEGIVD